MMMDGCPPIRSMMTPSSSLMMPVLEQPLPLKVLKEGFLEDCDCIVIVSIKTTQGYIPPGTIYAEFFAQINEQSVHDASFQTEGGFILLPPEKKIRRLIYSPVGNVYRDHDDVRRFIEAALKGVKRALKAGARKPIVVVPSIGSYGSLYPFYDVATVLGSFEAIYSPLEIRESIPQSFRKLNSISFTNFASDQREKDVFRLCEAIERGRNVARDIGGSDPERMSSPNVSEYVELLFRNSCIKTEIISDLDYISKEFPSIAIVNRGSPERHAVHVIFLTYEPDDGPIDQTLFFVGKGVTYDTGGADIKAGGIMAGMHRDKCGAAAIAGFFHTLSILKPKGLRCFGACPMVRNSISPDGYVADELMKSRAGVRVRIGNTDAEGRMAMVDFLAYFKEKVVKENHPNPQFFTIATLTAHACLAAGEFSIIMDNGPAKLCGIAKKIQEAGEKIGDIFEVSNIRREDFYFNKGRSEYEDVIQCNNLPSSRTPRGHQIPAAFLIQVSGLDAHGLGSEKQIPYSHIDIAASSGPFPGIPSGSPIPALAIHYLLSRDCDH